MYKIITCEQAKPLIESNSVTLFDARDELAFQNGHISGAKFLNRENLEHYCQQLKKDQPIIVYCYKGNRSKSISKVLMDKGFKDVASLDGGYSAWKQVEIQ